MKLSTAIILAIGVAGFVVNLLIWAAGERPSALSAVLSNAAFVGLVYLLHSAERRIDAMGADRG